MAVLPQDRRGQILLLLTVGAVVLGYCGWSGTGLSLVGLMGFQPLGLQRDSMQLRIDTLTKAVAKAKLDVAHGALSQLEARRAEFGASLLLMRQLVPARSEEANLLDDIASRAKMRGTIFAGYTPQANESGSPFDTHRYRVTVAGQYDQVAEFLTDVASLSRIIVPYDVHLQRVQGPVADTTKVASLLQATFSIKTYIKQPGPSDSTAAQPAPGRPAPAPRPAGREGGANRE